MTCKMWLDCFWELSGVGIVAKSGTFLIRAAIEQAENTCRRVRQTLIILIIVNICCRLLPPRSTLHSSLPSVTFLPICIDLEVWSKAVILR